MLFFAPMASAMNAAWLPSALSMAAPALASCETSFVLLAPRSRTAMSGTPLVFEPAGTTSSALVVNATRLPAALIVDSRLGASPEDVPAVLALTSTVEGEFAGLLQIGRASCRE